MYNYEKIVSKTSNTSGVKLSELLLNMLLPLCIEFSAIGVGLGLGEIDGKRMLIELLLNTLLPLCIEFSAIGVGLGLGEIDGKRMFKRD